MAATITSNPIGSVLISSPQDNPVYVSAGVTVAYGILLELPGPGTLINYGLIESSSSHTNQEGVYLSAGGNQANGTVANQTSGVISGYRGIDVVFGPAVVANAGIITGLSNDAINLTNGGTVVNAKSGIITAAGTDGHGIYVHTATGRVLNDGVITAVGSTSSGVLLKAGGTVSNAATGTITSANYHAVAAHAYLHLYNAGLLTAGGTHSVIASTAGGDITNATGGTITAQNAGGVYLSGTGSVIERVSNAAGGVISGYIGVYLTGGEEGVINLGRIIGLKKSGINLLNGGYVTNEQGGTIASQGTLRGIYIATYAGTVTNAGVIRANTGNGIVLNAGGTIVNSAGGTIASTSGLAVVGEVSAVTLSNAGLVSVAGTGVAVALHGGGTVDNMAGGTISAPNRTGVYLTGGVTDAGVVLNAGTVSGGGIAGDGVDMLVGGSVSNAVTGLITGAAFAVHDTGPKATVTNFGSIVASNSVFGSTRIGLALGSGSSGAYLTNANHAVVSGVEAVVLGGTDGTVANDGTLTAGLVGVVVTDGGTVDNQDGGTIQAGTFGGTIFASSYGVNVSGGLGTIQNAGTIQGGSRGVILQAGGTVQNLASGVIGVTATVANQAYADVAVTGAVAATIENAGTIGALAASGAATAHLTGIQADPGIYASSGLYLTNLATGVIGGSYGVKSTAGPVGISNAGTIRSNGAPTTLTHLPSAVYVGGSSGATAYLNNAASGLIYGALGVNVANTVGTVVNAGTIAGQSTAVGAAVALRAGGTVTNQSKAVISGGFDGVFGYYKSTAATTVTNAGTITGTYGIRIGAGSVSNVAGATISGAYSGVKLGKSGTILNAGTIADTYIGATLQVGFRVAAVDFNNRGNSYNGGTYSDYLSNASTGVITGAHYALVARNPTTVVNAGTIRGPGTLVAGEANRVFVLQAGGRVDNLAGGLITNLSSVPLAGAAPVVVVNAGKIQTIGNAETIDNDPGGLILTIQAADTTVNAGRIGNSTAIGGTAVSASGRVVVDPGAVFYGLVNGQAPGGSVASTLELAAGPFDGALSGLGTQFVNFGLIAIDADADWKLTGNNTVAPGVTTTNAGTITVSGTLVQAGGSFDNATSVIVDGGSLEVQSGAFQNSGTVTVENGGVFSIQGGAALSGAGTVLMESGSTTELALPVMTGQGFFYSDPATLVLDDVAAFDGIIGGFAAGDVIKLGGATITSGHISGTTLTLDLAGGGTQTLNVAPGESGLTFTASSGGLAVACFAAGTRILTATGELPVEALAAGDLVATLSGRLRPVRWIGFREILLDRHLRPLEVLPVRVRAHAFAPGVPHRDLLLSPDHAVAWEGALIPVRYLRNGATVRQQPVAAVTYFHVELDTHDVLLADGLPAESFLDTGNRFAFANGGEPIAAVAAQSVPLAAIRDRLATIPHVLIGAYAAFACSAR